MQYLRCDVKAQLGDKVAVSASAATRIMVMSSRDFTRYKNHQTFSYYGVANERQFELDIPKSGTWVAVIEKGSKSITGSAAITRMPRDKARLSARTEAHEAPELADQSAAESEA